jgi:hypothetical protein
MREIRPSGSEGGVRLNPSSLPLSTNLSLHELAMQPVSLDMACNRN